MSYEIGNKALLAFEYATANKNHADCGYAQFAQMIKDAKIDPNYDGTTSDHETKFLWDQAKSGANSNKISNQLEAIENRVFKQAHKNDFMYKTYPIMPFASPISSMGRAWDALTRPMYNKFFPKDYDVKQ